MQRIGPAASSGTPTTSPSDGATCSTQHAYWQQPRDGSCPQARDLLGPPPTTAHDLYVLKASCGTIQNAVRQRLARTMQTQTQTKRSHLWAGGDGRTIDYRPATALGELCPDENLIAREALRSNAVVESALATAWNACSQGASTLVREAYYTMARKLYLSLTLDGGGEPDPYECLRRLEGEWAHDAGAKELLTQEELSRSWFRLAGLHATAASAEGYAEWILAKVHTIAQPRFGEEGERDATIH